MPQRQELLQRQKCAADPLTQDDALQEAHPVDPWEKHGLEFRVQGLGFRVAASSRLDIAIGAKYILVMVSEMMWHKCHTRELME